MGTTPISAIVRIPPTISAPQAVSATPKLGLLLAALILCALPSCDKPRGTKDWNTPGATPPPPATQTTPAPGPQADSGSTTPKTNPKTAAETTPTGLRFITYNVENWLTMDRYVDQQQLPSASKPEKEKQAVATILARHQPDVLGICEIGTREDLAELQALLKSHLLDLPHAHYTGGSDPTRHLAILSRFPFTATATPAKLDFQLNGTTFGMNRGILDASIQARGKSYRFLGVHLKSQREVKEGDQAQMRLHEAHLLRDHVDAILASEPTARLVVYGDFNEDWGTPPLKTIVGTYNTPSYLTAIRAKDQAGVHWTHYWEIHDSYSRLDYVTVSQTLRGDTDFSNSRILDDPEWHDASDHRPVMALFK